jgi:3'(2'), 5'-bisphosphate nucleotidase
VNSIPSRRELLEQVLPVTRAAGQAVLDVYATNFEVRGKSDTSPVTAADERAEAIILAALAKLTPSIPVVSEEAAAAGHAPAVAESFWLVDPLDGTKEFINRNGEFTVNIALIENGYPTLGVVLAPALSRLFAGVRGIGAFLEENAQRRPIACRAGRKVASQTNAGSSLKLCLVAAGEADLYPRLGRTMEWDIAAGDAVLRAAGGMVKTLTGEPLVYGKPDFANPHFAAWGLEQAAASTGAS